MGNEKQEKYREFADKKDAFDKAYIEFMVKDHKKDIETFEKEVKDGKDADLKNWGFRKTTGIAASPGDGRTNSSCIREKQLMKR